MLRTIRIILDESFGVDFGIPAGGFSFLGWPRLLRPSLPPIAASGVFSVLGFSASLVASLPGGSGSAFVDQLVRVAVTGVGSDVCWHGSEQSPDKVSTKATSPSSPPLSLSLIHISEPTRLG